MLKQALDVLKKAETDAELTVASAKKRSAEIRNKAEEEKAELISKSIAAAKAEALAVASRYEAEADSIKADSERKSVEEAKLIEKAAAANRTKALNKAVERIVRRNGHR